MSLRFFTILLFLFGSCYADLYEQRIAQIINNGQQIKLTDGSIWNVLNNSEMAHEWHEGDTIQFHVSGIFSSGYYFYNFSVYVFDLMHPSESGSDVEIAIPCQTLPQNLTTIKDISSTGYSITLSDNSVFTIGWWYSWDSYKWKQNDRIIVFPDITSGYWLINLDQSNSYNVIQASL